MYIKNRRCWSTANGEQRASGSFLMLFSKVVGGEIRGAVRHVRMEQLGQWMMARVTLYGTVISLSGTYGNDGLVGDAARKLEGAEADIWPKLTPLPAALAQAVWKDDTGWNDAGRSGELVQKWALENIKALRRPYQGVNPNDAQRLYVVPVVNLRGRVTGYTSLGYDYAERQIRRMLDWLGYTSLDPLASEKVMAPGTVAHYQLYRRVVEHVRQRVNQTGRKCEIDLEPQLKGLEGRVVRVHLADGTTYSFRVGKSLGWIPCHLAVGPKAHGGGMVPGGPYEHVSVLGGNGLLEWSMGEAQDAID